VNPDTLRAIFQSITSVFVGGGLLALARFLLPKLRRAEIRTLDTTADSTALTSANAYILTLQAGDKVMRATEERLRGELKTMQKAWDDDRVANVDVIEALHREVARLAAELARVKSDLVIAQAQILELGSRMGNQPRHGRIDDTQMLMNDEADPQE
jgi:hypothetical protein